MASVSEHYENHLANYYSWLFGLKSKVRENRAFFKSHSILPRASAKAVDLGAGSGFQSIPLAELGFSVTAIDFSEKLLKELETNAQGLHIGTVKGDILRFSNHCPDKIELAVCMGDTLTHLKSKEDIQHLFHKVYQGLENHGKFILTFRDMTTELKDSDRFIPVRSDSNQIFTCFLEYEDDAVKVYDIVHEKTGNGWELKKSFYQKIRVGFDWTAEALEKQGFCIRFSDADQGIITFIAEKAV